MSTNNKKNSNRSENLRALIGLLSNGVDLLNKSERWVKDNCPDHKISEALLSGVRTLRARSEKEIAEHRAELEQTEKGRE